MRLAPIVGALAPSTPFIGPERLMRESGLRELVRLGANESAFGPSPMAMAAMGAELEHTSWYGDPDSYDLRVALAAKHACGIEQISVGSGIDDLMGLAVRAYVAPGAVAVTSLGSYPTFEYHVRGYGGALERVPYRADGRPDLEGLVRRAHDTNAAMVYVANPDNPSGTFYERAEIQAFCDALPHDAVLFLDEAYADFVEETELLAPTFNERLIRTRTFSKAYGMAGARIGYALMTEDGVNTFEKIRLQYGINRNAQIGALASLRDEAFRSFVVAETARGRDEYAALARAVGTTSLPSHTNFTCIDMGDASSAVAMVGALLARGVWIRKPAAAPLDRYIRVSVGTAPMRAAFAAAFRDARAEPMP
jgi:histidinol-phosphate aminotransferase